MDALFFQWVMKEVYCIARKLKASFEQILGIWRIFLKR